MKVTFEQINEFIQESNFILAKRGEEKESKLTYAIKKMQKRLRKHIDDYMEEMRDIEVEFASTDEKGNLLKVDKELVYTPASEKTVRKKKRSVYNEWLKKEFEIENYITTEVVEELTEDQQDALKGFVL
jgi:hypothetical protein